MAEFLLTFAVEQTLERVGSMAIQEIAGAWRLKKDVEKLSEFIQRILGKVQEARNNEAANRQALKPLLVKLQDVLYSAEDVLDDFSYEILRRQIEYQSQPWMRIRGFASRNNPILFHLKMARKVKKINQSLDDIEKQALREIAFIGKVVADPIVVSTDQPDRVTVAYFDKSAPPVIGRANEVEAIINMLQVSSSTPSLLTVVSIVGFGGLGKTTLAKMILHQLERTKLFDETIWVCVSEHFDVKGILKGMLETLDENAGGLDNVNAMLRHLKKKLEDKRFFLVLDDVWEDNSTKCNTLKSHLLTICNRAGNFVVVTTRISDVAKAMDTQHEHVVLLKGLEDKECWDIIREKCLLQWEGSMPEELKQVGIDVAEKCKGVPLAAKVIGGTLCKTKNREEWLSIKNSDAWEQIDEDNQIFPVLKLSFHHLDLSLKQCFIYCSLFPKDFEYDKEQLIELWMAEGFLNTTSANRGSNVKSMEDIGDECFNGLIVHSFLQDVEMDSCGNIMSCKMHDLLHDLATSISKELKRSGAVNVRSVISETDDDVSHMFSTYKSLRALAISCGDLNELTNVIGKFKHLRYLDISRNVYNIEEFLKIISKLYNLQTLRLCQGFYMLPNEMVNLKRLRHIHFVNHYVGIYKVGCLTELRTLGHFEVKSQEGFRIEELKDLNELRGKLTIKGLENVRDREEAEGANLKEKKLIELTLEWRSSSGSNNDENVLEGLMPPPTIKRLAITEYKGVKFPDWMSMGINNSQCQLTQLVELSLSNCNKCEMMPSLGHLPCLKILEVSDLNNIRCMGREFYGECKREVTLFPALKKLSVWNMTSVEEWVAVGAIEGGEETSVEVFPLLEELYIWGCPRLKSIPLSYTLVRVSIGWIEDMEYLSNDIQNLPSLNYLRVSNCRSLVSLSSMQGAVSLDWLNIEKCPKLKSVPHWIKDCSSLQQLCIRDCERVISMDDDIISSLAHLKKLSLGPFSEELKDFPGFNSIHQFSQIESLQINGWAKLKSLPQQLQHLTTLKKLSICDFKGVETLPEWLGNLSSLQELELSNCHNLKTLPTTMNHLSNLKSLSSTGCPLLKR